MRSAFEEWREAAANSAVRTRRLHAVLGRMRMHAAARAFMTWQGHAWRRHRARMAVIAMEKRALAAAFRTWRQHRQRRLQHAALMLSQHSMLTW